MAVDLNTAIERFDLETWLVDRGAREVQAGEWALQCFDCGKDEKVIVNVQRRAWHCWNCQKYSVVYVDGVARRRPIRGAGGLVDLIKAYDGGDRLSAAAKILSDARHSVDELHHMDAMRWEPPPSGDRDKQAPPIQPPEFATPIKDPLPYLVERGITQEDIDRLGLYVCYAGRYANRLIFPVWEGPNLVYFQARAMWPLRPGDIKALNPSREFCPLGAAVSTEVLLNLDAAAKYERVCLVEGPMDAVRAGPDSVCTFGKVITPIQEAKLLLAGVKAVDLMWDSDAIGDAWVAAATLSENFEVRVVALPEGDPADRAPGVPWRREELDAFRAAATPISTGVLL